MQAAESRYGRGVHAPNRQPEAPPSLRVATVDGAALARNIEQIVLGSDRNVLVDVSCDGFGHGASVVAGVALNAGAGLYVSRESDVALVAADGIDVVTPSLLAENGGIVVREDAYGLGDPRYVPVLSLRSHVIATKRVLAGEGVSYGYTFTFPSDGNTALVGLGYADGIHRHAGNRVSARLRGKDYPIVGRVAMDVFVLFLGSDVAELGDAVVMFGNPSAGEPPLVSWAESLKVAPLAVTSGVGPRVVRSVR